jgi:hypothetical protein
MQASAALVALCATSLNAAASRVRGVFSMSDEASSRGTFIHVSIGKRLKTSNNWDGPDKSWRLRKRRRLQRDRLRE